MTGSIDLSTEQTGVGNIIALADGSVAALVYSEDYSSFDLCPVDMTV